MPTNGSGIYSLPAGYVAIPGTTILDTQHNAPLEDLAQAQTDRLMRNGSNAMTGPLTLAGNASANLHATPLAQVQSLIAASSIFFNSTPSTGSANAQVVATMTNYALATGVRAAFVAGYTNTGATTLNIASTGVKNIYRDSPGGPQALTGGEIIVGQLVTVVYDGTQYVLQNSSLALLGPRTSLASASTTDLGTIPSHNINITGTTTITSFGSSASTTYPIYHITFAAALTLTHNASSLILPGSTNITTAANDSAVVQYLGSGNWLVMSYARASGGTIIPSVSVPVRQTVLSGPVDSNGLPNFWPTTSPTLNLTMQNVTTTPMTVTISNGFSSTGATDLVYRIISNLSISLPALSTSYVWYDGTNTLGSTVLAPIYQRGGTISIVSDQHTYDITAGQMYVGNGVSASPTNRVFIGEATSNGSTVTSTRCYAYAGKYVSPQTAFPAVLTPLNLSHNLGVVPGDWTLVLVNTTAELAFAVGDEVQDSSLLYTAAPNNKVLSVSAAKTTSTIIYNATGALYKKDGSAFSAINTANWRLKHYANRGW